MEMIAKGKWSKEQKRWNMVVLMQRPAKKPTEQPQPSKRPDRPRPR